MVWKYQNEIAPIFYYGISTKTNEKDIKIPKLQPPDWKSPYWMSLYISGGITKATWFSAEVGSRRKLKTLVRISSFWKMEIVFSSVNQIFE